MASLCRRYCDSADSSPTAKGVGHERVGAGLRQQGTEIALVGVVVECTLRPRQRNAFYQWVEVTYTCDIARSSAVSQLRQQEQDHARDEQDEEKCPQARINARSGW